MNAEDWNERGFRNALGDFATGVAVAICQVDGVLYGSTISSFNSVSLAPPLVLFSLARTASTFPQWRATTHFSIMVLGEHQDEVSNRFARGGAEKWADITPRYTSRGVPVFRDGLVTFECETYARYDGGDHEIIVGRVLSFERKEMPPLLFFRGRYRRLQSEQVETPLGLAYALYGW